MWSAVSFRILLHGSTRSPSQGSTAGPCRDGRRGRRGRTQAETRRSRRGGGGRGRPIDELQHIALGHASRGAGAGNGAQVEPVLGHHLPDQRSRLAAEPFLGRLPAVGRGGRRAAARPRPSPRSSDGAWGRSGSRCWCRCRGRSCRRGSRCARRGRGSTDRGIGFDPRHHGLDGDGLPFLDQDLGEHTSVRRGNFGVDLVGRDLEDRLVALDGVADLLEPLRQRALGDGFTHLGHYYIDLCHSSLHSAVMSRGS